MPTTSTRSIAIPPTTMAPGSCANEFGRTAHLCSRDAGAASRAPAYRSHASASPAPSTTMRAAVLLGALVGWVLLSLPRDASAHRLDEYLQATRVDVGADGIGIEIDLTPGANI